MSAIDSATSLTPTLQPGSSASVSFEDHEGEERVTVHVEHTANGITVHVEHYPLDASELLTVDTKVWELNEE